MEASLALLRSQPQPARIDQPFRDVGLARLRLAETERLADETEVGAWFSCAAGLLLFRVRAGDGEMPLPVPPDAP
eukprot:718325-Alexandrium_andersonii.AAC.1